MLTQPIKHVLIMIIVERWVRHSTHATHATHTHMQIDIEASYDILFAFTFWSYSKADARTHTHCFNDLAIVLARAMQMHTRQKTTKQWDLQRRPYDGGGRGAISKFWKDHVNIMYVYRYRMAIRSSCFWKIASLIRCKLDIWCIYICYE